MLSGLHWHAIQLEPTTPTLGPVQRLWSHIFGDQRGYLGLLAGLRAPGGRLDDDDARQAFYNYPGQAHAAERWLHRRAAVGREAYFCAHLLTEQRRRKEFAAPLLALYVDGDGATGPDHLPPPTAVVESSPGREHYYWRLSRPVRPELGEELNRRLAYAMGGDRSGWDLSQTLRPPGFANHKYPDRPVTRLVVLRDAAYDPDELERWLPLVPDTKPPDVQATAIQPRQVGGPTRAAVQPPTAAAKSTPPPVRLNASRMRIWRGESPAYNDDRSIDRSRSLYFIGRILHQSGASHSQIVAAVEERDHSLGWNTYTGRRDADRQYQTIADKVGRLPRRRSPTTTIPLR